MAVEQRLRRRRSRPFSTSPASFTPPPAARARPRTAASSRRSTRRNMRTARRRSFALRARMSTIRPRRRGRAASSPGSRTGSAPLSAPCRPAGGSIRRSPRRRFRPAIGCAARRAAARTGLLAMPIVERAAARGLAQPGAGERRVPLAATPITTSSSPMAWAATRGRRRLASSSAFSIARVNAALAAGHQQHEPIARPVEGGRQLGAVLHADPARGAGAGVDQAPAAARAAAPRHAAAAIAGRAARTAATAATAVPTGPAELSPMAIASSSRKRGLIVSVAAGGGDDRCGLTRHRLSRVRSRRQWLARGSAGFDRCEPGKDFFCVRPKPLLELRLLASPESRRFAAPMSVR